MNRLNRIALRSMGLALAATALSATMASADPGDPSKGFLPDGVKEWQTYGAIQATDVLPDGRIVIGYNSTDTETAHLKMFRPNGKVDATFGVGGEVDISPLLDVEYLIGVSVAGSKITVLMNDSNEGGLTVVEVARFTLDGSFDPTFGGGDGRVTFTAGAIARDAVSLVARFDGTTYVLADGTVEDAIVYKLAEDGSPDLGFSGDGEAPVPHGLMPLNASSIDVSGRGSIVVGSTTNGAADPQVVVSRMKANGEAKADFGDAGVVSFGKDDNLVVIAREVKFAPGRHIVIAGSTTRTASSRFTAYAARLNGSDGSLDTSFGGDGFVDFRVKRRHVYLGAVEVQSDGKVLLGLSVHGHERFVTTRYLTNGQVDTSYGTDGRTSAHVGVGEAGYLTSMAIRPDGRRVVIGGWVQDDFEQDGAIGSYSLV